MIDCVHFTDVVADSRTGFRSAGAEAAALSRKDALIFCRSRTRGLNGDNALLKRRVQLKRAEDANGAIQFRTLSFTRVEVVRAHSNLREVFMSFVFAPPQQAVIPVQNERYEFFPVRRVYCIARNYRMPGEGPLAAGETLPEPIFFMKPADAVVPVAEGTTLKLPFPPKGNNLRPELELVACLSKGGRNLSLEEAEAAIWGWCVGIDFARGDLQDEAKKNGRPWETAKVFDRCTPVSYVRPAYRAPMPAPADVYFYVGNEKRQSGNTSQMLRSPAEVIALLSTYWTLEPGDLVFTGTPAGVAPVKQGDRLMGGVNGVGQIKVDLI